ncbi:MAG: GNAT family N-acetyltransferase [Spirochaetes bacterium]|nr:GNAT family N-acetyltransferase [Spirochaetota bacterium]
MANLNDDMESLRITVEHLSHVIGPRAPGSDGEKRAAEYIQERFSRLGISAAIEEFESPSCTVTGASLRIGDGNELTACPMQFSPAGSVSGPLVFLGSDEHIIIDETSVSGAVGIITAMGGGIARNRLARSLEDRGLAALIVVNGGDEINTKLIREPLLKRMPVLSVPFSTARILWQNRGKSITAEVRSDTTGTGVSRNVIATVKGVSDDYIVLCAHYDTASLCPGATDDAGGVAALLAAASVLGRSTHPLGIVFLASGSEEHGGDDGTGRGAQAFFKKRAGSIDRIRAFIDTDNVGGILSTPALIMGGPGVFKRAIENASLEQRYRRIIRDNASHGCDSGAAYQYGIPYVWMTNALSPRPYYHTPSDGIENIDCASLSAAVRDIVKLAELLAAQGPFLPWDSDQVIIRPARMTDMPSIGEITGRAFDGVSMDKMQEEFFGEQLGGREWRDYKSRSVMSFCRENLYCTIVAEYEGRTVGYATYQLHREKGIAEISNNAVHPDHQGKGIGKRLQTEVARRMREEGYTRFTVSTLSVDIPAQKLYEKLGYRKYAETFHYLK